MTKKEFLAAIKSAKPKATIHLSANYLHSEMMAKFVMVGQPKDWPFTIEVTEDGKDIFLDAEYS